MIAQTQNFDIFELPRGHANFLQIQDLLKATLPNAAIQKVEVIQNI